MKSDNYFDDAAQNQVGDNAGDGMPEGSEKRGQDQEDEKYDKTALINSEICPGMKPGDVMELKILSVRDGEYEVQYSPAEKSEAEGSEGEMPQAEPQESMMD